jgi:prepilin-type N-terminal cleavage/methylation domain-containing protein
MSMHSNRPTGQDGFTLAEVMIAMALFLIIIALAGQAFNKVITTSKVVTKSEESNIEGVVGLEMLRHDLEQAGFGLYTDVDSPIPTFTEATSTPASFYNDSSTGIPRALLAGDNLNPTNDSTNPILANTDYLVIKSSNLGLNQASLKWSYVNYTSTSLVGTSKIWPVSGDNLTDGVDKVVVMRQSYKNGVLSRHLIYDNASPTNWAQTFKADGSYGSTYKPNIMGLQYYYYGLGNSTPLTPFNRVDYVVKRVAGEMSSSCAPGAGTLYKTALNQADGSMTSIPVQDCVADMQVVFGWNTSGVAGSTSVDTWTNADGTSYGPGNAAVSVNDPTVIRTQLKMVKVYILAQDGGFDKTFTNTANNFLVGDPVDTPTSPPVNLVHNIDLTGVKYQNYRWKLYRIVVRPLNLN